jgi:hypothetical protein
MSGPDRPSGPRSSGPRSSGPGAQVAGGGRTGARRGRVGGPAADRRAEPPVGDDAGGRGPGRDGETVQGRAVRGDARGQAATTYRGVRWERNGHGRLRWRDDDGDRWVLWKPGQDAPPRPPAWSAGAEALGTPLRDRRARAGWRSPYRIVPVVLVALVVVIGVVQAVRSGPPTATAAEKAAAEKLLGRCLVVDGTASGQPRYEAESVDCSSPRASVRVVKVLPGTPGSPACPAGTTTVQLAYPGVTFPHRECVQRVVR